MFQKFVSHNVLHQLFIIFVCCNIFCSGKIWQKITRKVDWGKSAHYIEKIQSRALRCENGKLVGTDKLLDVFVPLLENCMTDSVHKEDKYTYLKAGMCFMSELGLMDTNGAPYIPKMDAFFQIAYSGEIFERVPELPQQFHICVKEYADDYNNAVEMGKQDEIYESFNVLGNCIDQASSKLFQTTDVCSLKKTHSSKY